MRKFKFISILLVLSILLTVPAFAFSRTLRMCRRTQSMHTRFLSTRRMYF